MTTIQSLNASELATLIQAKNIDATFIEAYPEYAAIAKNVEKLAEFTEPELLILWDRLNEFYATEELTYRKDSAEIKELLEGIMTKGINYIADNFKLLGIEPTATGIIYSFEHELTLTTEGGSLSGVDSCETILRNGLGEILATW